MIEKNQLNKFFEDFIVDKDNSYIDLHIHTDSSDGFIGADFFIEFLENIPHLISITDHNAIDNNLKLQQNKNLNVVPGIEIGCKDGLEFLIYFKTPESLEEFYTRSVEPFKINNEITRTRQTHTYFLKEARKYDSLISIPHIAGMAHKNYLKNKNYIKKIIKSVDAIETYNHSIPKNRNLIAKKVRKIYNKTATFGSDAHFKQAIHSFQKMQNNDFSKIAEVKNNLYNCYSLLGLLGKHLASKI